VGAPYLKPEKALGCGADNFRWQKSGERYSLLVLSTAHHERHGD